MKKPLIITAVVVVLAGPAAIALFNPGFNFGESVPTVIADSTEIEDGESVSKVNTPIRIGKGESAGSLKNVNGSVAMGEGASADSVKTVNGSISLDEESSVGGSVASVNGSITVERGVTIGGELKSVNGRIRAHEGTVVKGAVESVNGTIDLEGVEAASLTTTNSTVKLSDGTVILGDLTVRKPKSAGFSFGIKQRPEIVIGENCEVRGNLNFEQEVELTVHASAKIGEITGVEPIRK